MRFPSLGGHRDGGDYRSGWHDRPTGSVVRSVERELVAPPTQQPDAALIGGRGPIRSAATESIRWWFFRCLTPDPHARACHNRRRAASPSTAIVFDMRLSAPG